MQTYLFIVVGALTLIGAATYPVAVVVLADQAAGYSHTSDFISELGEAGVEHAWLLNFMLLAEGLITIALAWAVQKSIIRGNRPDLAVILIGLFGVSLLVGGLFPCDVGCEPSSLNGWIHVLNAIPSALATLATPFLMTKRLRRHPDTRGLASLSFVTGILTVAFVLSSATLFPLIGYNGLGQRLVLITQLFFYVLIAYAVIEVNLTQTLNRRLTGSEYVSS